MAAPLASLKVLDFTSLLPGPYATMVLADLGAAAVRIESANRPDMVRDLQPFDGDISAWHGVLNRNKRSLALDLKRPEATEVVRRLVEGGYDIVIEQFRPGVMDRLGIGYEALRAINPGLIYGSLTGYGQSGPLRNRAGHDLNYLALSGALSYGGRQETGPSPMGIQVADIGGGAFGALVGLLAAVVHRSVSGQGQYVDISMFDMMVAWQAHLISQTLVGGETPQPESMSLNGGQVYDLYETADQRWLAVGAIEAKFWEGFCRAIERPDLVAPGESADPGQRAWVKDEIRQVMASRALTDWAGLFEPLDVCVEPVLTVPEMLDHPQVVARGLVVDVPRPDGGTQRQVASPWRFSEGSAEYRHAGVALGVDTREVLAGAGYSPEEIEAFISAGVASA